MRVYRYRIISLMEKKICENKFVSLLKAFYREIFNRISKYLMHNYIGIIGRR